jgi:hypothetical protein
MKKFLIASVAMLGITVASFAQATPATKEVKEEKPKMEVVKKEKEISPAKVVEMNQPKAAAAVDAAAPLKADGTPDKRYKANKNKKGLLKADGTLDMRYKKNKKG